MVDNSHIPGGDGRDNVSEFQVIWARYRWHIITIFVVVIGAVAINEVIRHRASVAATERFDAIENDRYDDADISASPLALLAQGQAMQATGDIDGARSTFNAIINSANADPLLKDRAVLALTTLESSAEIPQDSPYEDVLAWVEIDRLIGEGNEIAARDRLQTLLANSGSARTPWAETLLLALGGEIPELQLDEPINSDGAPEDE